jgi:hypothetical protein
MAVSHYSVDSPTAPPCSIAQVVQASGSEVPEWMLTMDKPRRAKKGRVVDRKPITSDPKVLQKVGEQRKKKVRGIVMEFPTRSFCSI